MRLYIPMYPDETVFTCVPGWDCIYLCTRMILLFPVWSDDIAYLCARIRLYLPVYPDKTVLPVYPDEIVFTCVPGWDCFYLSTRMRLWSPVYPEEIVFTCVPGWDCFYLCTWMRLYLPMYPDETVFTCVPGWDWNCLEKARRCLDPSWNLLQPTTEYSCYSFYIKKSINPG